MAGASSGALETALTTPFGRPASFSTSMISRWVRGHISEVFITTVLPQASGVASARTPRITGAFQGAIDSTTPAGCRTAMASEPGRFEGMISPVIWVVIAAASRSMSAASITLNCAQPAVAPISSAMAATNSGPLAARMSAAFERMARRSRGEERDHSGNAAAAASTAAIASATVAAAALVATLAGDRVAALEGGAVRGLGLLVRDHQSDYVHLRLLQASASGATPRKACCTAGSSASAAAGPSPTMRPASSR